MGILKMSDIVCQMNWAFGQSASMWVYVSSTKHRLHLICREGIESGVLYAVDRNFHVLACHLGGIVFVKHISQQYLLSGVMVLSGKYLGSLGVMYVVWGMVVLIV